LSTLFKSLNTRDVPFLSCGLIQDGHHNAPVTHTSADCAVKTADGRPGGKKEEREQKEIRSKIDSQTGGVAGRKLYGTSLYFIK